MARLIIFAAIIFTLACLTFVSAYSDSENHDLNEPNPTSGIDVDEADETLVRKKCKKVKKKCSKKSQCCSKICKHGRCCKANATVAVYSNDDADFTGLFQNLKYQTCIKLTRYMGNKYPTLQQCNPANDEQKLNALQDFAQTPANIKFTAGRCLSAENDGYTNGDKALEADCAGTPNLLWKSLPGSGNAFQLQLQSSGGCLTAETKEGVGFYLDIYNCRDQESTPWQYWQIFDATTACRTEKDNIADCKSIKCCANHYCADNGYCSKFRENGEICNTYYNILCNTGLACVTDQGGRAGKCTPGTCIENGQSCSKGGCCSGTTCQWDAYAQQYLCYPVNDCIRNGQRREHIGLCFEADNESRCCSGKCKGSGPSNTRTCSCSALGQHCDYVEDCCLVKQENTQEQRCHGKMCTLEAGNNG